MSGFPKKRNGNQKRIYRFKSLDFVGERFVSEGVVVFDSTDGTFTAQTNNEILDSTHTKTIFENERDDILTVLKTAKVKYVELAAAPNF